MLNQHNRYESLVGNGKQSNFYEKSFTCEGFKMVKPKRKVSKVAIVVTTHTMCFNCYCHQTKATIKPYQRMTKRRKAVRYKNRGDFPSRYRFENEHQSDQLQEHIIVTDWNFSATITSSFNSLFPPFFHSKSGDSSGSRQIRNTPDWSDNAVSGDHLWVPTSVSGDCCYIGDNDCTVSIEFLNLLKPLMWQSYYTAHSIFFRGVKHANKISIETSLRAFSSMPEKLNRLYPSVNLHIFALSDWKSFSTMLKGFKGKRLKVYGWELCIQPHWMLRKSDFSINFGCLWQALVAAHKIVIKSFHFYRFHGAVEFYDLHRRKTFKALTMMSFQQFT